MIYCVSIHIGSFWCRGDASSSRWKVLEHSVSEEGSVVDAPSKAWIPSCQLQPPGRRGCQESQWEISQNFLADELTGPLDVDFRFGVQESWDRTADIIPPPQQYGQVESRRQSLTGSSRILQKPTFRKAQAIRVNWFATAHGLARIGSLVSTQGTVDGKRLVSHESVEKII
ncbi:hypothetical protein N7495_009092 [Penicillium taxi]|uniref:uncharacterized protein n=1 Tax=Penicillium taxi TaxID=168475 RepID=UPI002545343C|nr:uncharacterized protein N7495_009092 [Penicillium taxi]KAJ5889051.1 hypothetical protein N7495_009092 [Penicillium taxi]